MVFQPELFDPGRGEYVCGCGYRSGRVYEEKRPVGSLPRQVAVKEKQHDVSIQQKKKPEKSKVQPEKMKLEIEPVEVEQPEKKEPVKAEQEIQPVPQKPARPIWQAKRVRAIRNVGWKVDGRLRTWFRAGKEYGCLAHHSREAQYLSVMFASGGGVITWSSDCNDHPEKYWKYGRLLDDVFFLKHFEVVEWEDEG